MGKDADIDVENGIAQIVLNAGPSARLTTSVLRSLDAALDRLEQDPAIDYVVMRGKGSAFPSGITAPAGGGDDADNLLAALCLRIERFPKPVIAILSGVVVGGGVELALATHYRLAHTATRIGFPNARLGLVPSAGATQRLPRLIGAAGSLDLLVNGQLKPVTDPQIKAIVDQVFDDDPQDAIARFVQSLRDNKQGVRPTAATRAGFSDATGYQASVTSFRKTLEPSVELAPKQILSAIEAAVLLPIDAGLAFEQALAEDCAETEQARALSHVFRAEHPVSAETRRNDLPTLHQIVVLGGGVLASQLVLAALVAGLRVNWVIKDPAQHRDSVGHLQHLLQDAVMQGRLTSDQAKHGAAALRHGDAPDMVSDADLVLRAARGQRGLTIPDHIPVAHCLPGTDARLMLRFAPPAATARLIEIVMGPDGSDHDKRTALALARQLRKLAIVQNGGGLALSDRLTQTLWKAADALVDLGQSPYAIDRALHGWGMPHPPFELEDFTGLKTVAMQARADGARNWAKVALEQGRDGRASGRGFYVYENGVSKPDHAFLEHINQTRPPQPGLAPKHILRLILGAVANDAAKALRASVVPRAGDIDLVSVFAHLCPTWHGGFLHAVGENGLLQTARAMESVGHPDTALWTPDPIFADLIKYGRSFDDL